MMDLLLRSNFFLYEIGFLLLAWACLVSARSQRQLSRALSVASWWIASFTAASLLVACVGIHLAAYHWLLPRYVQTPTAELLRWMYFLKSASMLCIFLAGAAFAVGQIGLARQTSS